jgi:hypothetical protein
LVSSFVIQLHAIYPLEVVQVLLDELDQLKTLIDSSVHSFQENFSTCQDCVRLKGRFQFFYLQGSVAFSFKELFHIACLWEVVPEQLGELDQFETATDP